MITNPRLGKSKPGVSRAWVPIRRVDGWELLDAGCSMLDAGYWILDVVPDFELWTLDFGLGAVFWLPVCNSTGTPRGVNHFVKLRKCCSARISVGTISATL